MTTVLHFAATYDSASFIRRNTKKFPALFSPAMTGHNKDEKTLKLFCDTLPEMCPGLAFNLTGVGADG